MDMSKETEKKIQELQYMEQNMQSFLMQRQNFLSQLNEVTSALEEVSKAKKSFKIIGNVMVKMEKDDLKKDLEQKKETAELRIKSLEKQEAKVKEKAQELQAEVMEELNKVKNK